MNFSKPKVTHWLSGEELLNLDKIGNNFRETPPPTAPVTTISEFQPMQGVIVKYPFGIPGNLVAEMSEVVPVTIIVENNYYMSNATSYLSSLGVDMSNINYITATTDSYWTRDFGPIFIIDGNDEFGITDFIYNRPRPYDDDFMEVIANHFDINLFSMNMIHTGGNFMADGYGTAASTTLLLTENTPQTEADLDDLANDYLGIDNYLLLPDPMDDYIEHIDCWAKFLDVDKIIIGQVPQSDYRYDNYETLADWFATQTTPWGNKYQVYRVFTPGNSAIVPYTNSLILNDHVFVPQSGCSYDAGAITAYSDAMPGYTIVPVSYNDWENTDALHCRTHEIADLNMLLIRHYPILGEQHYLEHYTISADITAFSGTNLMTDSLLVYYSVNGSDWQTEPLISTGGKSFSASLPTLPENSEVRYYIFAKDDLGKREKHPYIGEADPHVFITGTISNISTFTQQQLYSVSPNPCKESFTLDGAPFTHIHVYNALGQDIMEQDFPNSISANVDCSKWKAGVYIIKIETPAGTQESVKCVVSGR